MAEVLLQDYLEQLRGHVRAGHYDDAFALGKHILHYFPKHIETYIVLAQASLETSDLPHAADLYRRVLSADPENVLALGGMALLSESQEKYDDALWYLERAQEINPTNDEIRRELLRVRETYYGGHLPRLELSAGALARIYARQGQYAHAVNEFRRLLRTESERYDARVALAETLFRAGRTDEAAQLAQAVMADAPYSLKPNLILGALWSENGVPEAQEFLRRAQALDPENRVARELVSDQFEHSTPPRLPAIDGQVTNGQGAVQAATVASEEPAHPSELRRELEVEPETTFGELDALTLVASDLTPAAPQATIPAEPAGAPPSSAPAGTTFDEIAAAERAVAEQAPKESAPQERAPSQFATRLSRARAASDAVPADAVAAAAAALVSSIAVDKTNQPAPVRRSHPAIPKVRPVIRGAAEKLPAWLRLGSTPAAASVSFEAPPPTTADKIAPIATPSSTPAPQPIEPVESSTDERPAWLVQAQASALQNKIKPQPEQDLPDWLRAIEPAQPPPAPASPPAETVAPASALPEWLDQKGDAESAPATEPPAAEATKTVAALPEWLERDAEAKAAQEPPPVAEPAVSAGWTDQPPPIETVELHDIAKTVEPMARKEDEPLPKWLEKPPPPPEKMQEPAEPIESAAAAPEKPLDALTLIENARVKRANRDLKGALDLYERAMHKRPNHLDQVIAELQDVLKDTNAPSSAHRLLGEAYAMAGRFKESLEQYRIAMSK